MISYVCGIILNISMDENTIFQGQNIQSEKATLPLQNQKEVPPQESYYASSSPSFFSKIIKIVLGIVVLAILLFVIFNVVLPKFQKPKETKITITYWGLWEDARIMQSIFNDFKNQYPNISINYIKQDVKQYRERLTTRIQNGSGPDVFTFHNTWVQMLSPNLLPLPSETISKAEFAKSFYPVAQKDLIKQGAIYGIPLEIDTLSLYTNNKIFQAAGLTPPTTWDDFSRDARSLTVKEDGNIKTAGAALGTFNNVTHAGDIISMLFVQNGVNLNNISGTSQAASDTLTFYTSFGAKNGNVWDKTLEESIIAFAKDNLAMYFGYSWDFFAIKAINPNLSFSINPVPRLLDRDMTIASYWVEGVSSKSRYQKEALLFMKFLAKKETAEKLFTEESKTRSFGEPYARVDLAGSLKDNSSVYPFVLQAPSAQSSFFVDSTYDNGLNTKTNSYLGTAVESIINNGTSPQSAVDTLSAGVNQVLKQYGQ